MAIFTFSFSQCKKYLVVKLCKCTIYILEMLVKHRQRFRLSICSHFGRVCQIQNTEWEANLNSNLMTRFLYCLVKLWEKIALFKNQKWGSLMKELRSFSFYQNMKEVQCLYIIPYIIRRLLSNWWAKIMERLQFIAIRQECLNNCFQ